MNPLLVTLMAGCSLVSGIMSGPDDAYTGTVEVTEVDVSSIVPGRLVSIDVREGDKVAQGQAVFSLEATQLEAQLALREGQVAQAAAAIDAAKAQVRAVDAQVALLDRERGRVVGLVAAGVGTDQQSSTSEGQYQVALAQAAAARELVAQATAALAQAEAGLDVATLQLDETQVEAPMAGVVLSRNREPGEVVGAGMSVLTLGDLEHPRLRVYLPLKTVETVKLGDPVEVLLDARPDEPLSGTVQWISSEAEFTPRDILTPDERVKRVFAVDVSLPPERGVHPGVPAEVRLVEG